MATKIIWSDHARHDLDTIFLSLLDFSESYAQEWIKKVFSNLELLETFPEMGRMVPEKEVRFLREVIVWKYRVLYTYLNQEITVIRIVHSSRPLGKI
ncbi:type II toxin-antitoxin system RelE/ParE family toxin [Runella sp.]|jgi:plasmid stabilization system protein ParE|uniref:type II toxin-antitoxin system RelE/ParE family toxin n=1 Tax=Runella sp. TaxID=1960881 RepID=UPI00301A8C3F